MRHQPLATTRTVMGQRGTDLEIRNTLNMFASVFSRNRIHSYKKKKFKTKQIGKRRKIPTGQILKLNFMESIWKTEIKVASLTISEAAAVRVPVPL
jgi:hypothetical protein